jgi:ornithine cyclodeaminase/alanine dehydrogenase-like protein (mu-crystallin family)
VESGAIEKDQLVTLAQLVQHRSALQAGRPRLFKSTGMAWEDVVVAAAVAG